MRCQLLLQPCIASSQILRLFEKEKKKVVSPVKMYLQLMEAERERKKIWLWQIVLTLSLAIQNSELKVISQFSKKKKKCGVLTKKLRSSESPKIEVF
jgi:hypothetical protein